MHWLLHLVKSVFGIGKTVLITNDGRSGQVVYTDFRGSIEFYYEFGGGDCLAIVTVPNITEWMMQTGRSLSDRTMILNYVGSELVRQQAPEYIYMITEDAIEVRKPLKPA